MPIVGLGAQGSGPRYGDPELKTSSHPSGFNADVCPATPLEVSS